MQSSSERPRSYLVFFIIVRTLLNTGHRMAYPFIPLFARSLGVDRSLIELAVAARAGLGLVAPPLSAIGDSKGRKNALMLGLGIFAGAMLLVTLSPTYPGLFMALMLASGAKIIFDPALHAFVGDRVIYAKRGRAIGLIEMSWSWSFLLGVPFAGWLVARGDWRTPFPVLGLLGLVALALLWRLIPADSPAQDAQIPSFWVNIRQIAGLPGALAGIAVGLLINLSNELINIVFGSWIEDVFGINTLFLGFVLPVVAAAVIGIADFGGESLVTILTDRVGKRQAVIGGFILNGLSGLLLPVIGRTIPGALIGLFLLFITYEFTLVSSIPLITELAPNARATLLGSFVAGLSAGRLCGGLLGGWLYGLGSLGVPLAENGIVAALLNVIGLFILAKVIPRD